MTGEEERMRTLLGLTALVAFVAYCVTREPGVAAPRPRMAGDGDRQPSARPPPPAKHVHAGDPSVRH